MFCLKPRLHQQDLSFLAGSAVAGALAAGLYGILHDQITYTLSPDYFTCLKFIQFSYADFGWPVRCLVAEIGFLASWWVGLMGGWFLARLALPGRSRPAATRLVAQGIGIILLSAALTATTGWLTVRSGAVPLESWQTTAVSLGVQDIPHFTETAWIHNGSYLGAVIGLILSLLYLKHNSFPAIGPQSPGDQP